MSEGPTALEQSLDRGILAAPPARELAIRICAALFGFALAISLVNVWQRPAPPGQLPGYMTSVGLDAHGPFRFFASLVILPLLVSWLSGPMAKALAAAQERWPSHLVAGASLTALWIATFVDDWRWVALPVAVAIPVALLLRSLHAGFTRRDLILVPTLVPVYFALLDLAPRVPGIVLLVMGAALLIGLRLLLSALDRPNALPASLAFALSPLGLAFQTVLSAKHLRHSPWPPLLLAFAAPPLLWFALRGTAPNVRRLLVAIGFVVYPIYAFVHPLAASAWCAEGKQRVNVFEVSHSLLPASEMLRGEKPYRDIIPGHGLLEDGLLDFLALRLHGANVGDALKAHSLVGDLNSIAIYALGAAATGSPEAGILGFLLSRALIPPGTIFLRSAPALFALALMIAAVRRRKRTLLGWAGAVAGAGLFVGVEFAVYALATLAIAALRSSATWRNRLRSLAAGAIGAGAAALAGIAALSVAGLGIDFLRVTILEVLTLGPVYNIGFFNPPAIFRTFRFFPEAMAGFFDPQAVFFGTWLIALLVAAVGLGRNPLRAWRRSEPLLLIAIFSLFCIVSYAERHHLFHEFAAGALLVTIAWRAFRSRHPLARAAAPLVVAALLTGVQLTAHFSVMTMLRLAQGPLDSQLVQIWNVPRAQGAWFDRIDAARIESMRKFVSAQLARDETFFDFTNRGLAYYLFDKDCPIRQYEVAYYEKPERQREVIQRLEQNRHVRAALVPSAPDDATRLDGVPLQDRAPLVWEYLQRHFQPAFQEGDVVFWRRK